MSDLERLRAEYAERDRRLAGSDIYSIHNIAYLFALQQRQRALLDLLRHEGRTLRAGRILEVGCGSGGVLHELLAYQPQPAQIHGTDLLLHRVQAAHERLPGLALSCADGQFLPYAAGSFQVVVQSMMFSSILDAAIKARAAQEMLRVLNHSDGFILWYDFWMNPTNPQTRGIPQREIRTLFPGCRCVFRRVTLAPPLARRIVPRSWLAGVLLEKLKVLNTHLLAVIYPPA